MPRRDSSDSSSDRSDYKRKSKKRKRQSSSSSSADSDRRYHHRSSRSTSSSRSNSRERSRRRRSHSVSRERSHKHRSSRSSSRECSRKHRSHSGSRDRSYKHRSRRSRTPSVSHKHDSRHNSRSSRHRVRSHSKNKKSRSSSRSDSHSRSSKKSTRRSRSRSRSPHRQKSSSQGSKMREDDVIKLKLQQALKAAATADAELRERGLLPEQASQKIVNNNSVPSIAEQVKHAQAIEEINSPTFTQHSFTSGISSVKQEKSIDVDIHTAAIFGNSCPVSSNDTTACINNTTATTKAMREIWKNNPEKLAHENLFEDTTIKTERWKKKLLALRRRKLNGEHMM